jgi:4-hydroxy-3-polyprenylbenzoate decarboxylase
MPRVEVRDWRLRRVDGKVGVGERVAVPRFVVAASELTTKIAERSVDGAVRLPDIGAAVSSGSFVTAGMLVAPCSIKTLSGIAHSYNENLVVRAADVCLKERRRVVLMLRETPLHAGHIDIMARATRNGAIIMPPVPAFYALPVTLDDVVNQTVGPALELFDISLPGIKRWNGVTIDGNGDPHPTPEGTVQADHLRP